jgi:hypothetical protein
MTNLSSISQGNGKLEKAGMDPDELARMVNVELAQQRAKWQRVSAQRNILRAASLLFLLAIIGGTFIAFFYYFSLGGVRPKSPDNVRQPTRSASPTER